MQNADSVELRMYPQLARDIGNHTGYQEGISRIGAVNLEARVSKPGPGTTSCLNPNVWYYDTRYR